MKLSQTVPLLLLLTTTLQAQTPTIQDCLGAIPVCTEVYTETTIASGDGNYPNEINGLQNGGQNCMDQEVSSVWYTFTVNNTGDFGFLLEPNDVSDDYDWALFNITNADCGDIYDDPSLLVSCNAAGGDDCNGLTGASNGSIYSNQGGGCNNFPPDQLQGFSAFNTYVSVQAGNTYALLVSNWTESPNGYTINFGASGDLGIFDDIDPMIQAVETPDACAEGPVIFEFSENVQLSTITSSNFLLTGPGGTYTAVVSSAIGRVGGMYDKRVEVTFDPPISEPGTYTIEVVLNAADEVLDLCDNQLSNPDSYSFEVNSVAISVLNLLQPDTVLCVGGSITVNATHALATSYLWSDGRTDPIIVIEDQGHYTVELFGDCGSASDDINIDLVNCQECTLFIPTGFSPNSDGNNDVFEVHSPCLLQDFSIKIFDRWGRLISSSDRQDMAWDGKDKNQTVPPGVFTYVLEFEVQEQGETFFRMESGDITVLR